MLFFSVVRDPSLVYNPPETKANDYLLIEFHCLLLALQWGFDDTSDVYICFAAPVLGSFKYCYGPMQKINRYRYVYTVLLFYVDYLQLVFRNSFKLHLILMLFIVFKDIFYITNHNSGS